MGILRERDGRFYLLGEPFRILSGAIHYFRVPPEYWEDRLKKLRACGFNTVETYVCWNLHERVEGRFDFSGRLDLCKFIQTAQKVGLYVILRPGPFICAEWELGGLPSWLLTYPNMKLRSSDPVFLQKVERYFRRLFREIRPCLSTNGGNVIALQIENEYGSFGSDRSYLEALEKMYRDNEVNEYLFTSDGAEPFALNCGSLPPYLAAVNFGSRSSYAMRCQREFQPGRPFFCAEYWCGWFDHWYENHHLRSAESVTEDLDILLSAGGSVNIFPFHGGTNFGYTNGANLGGKHHSGVYQPTVTSYDYDAPLSECGDMTPKYYALKDLLTRHFGELPEIEVHNLPKKAYGGVWLHESLPLLTAAPKLADLVKSIEPPTMEELGQDFGFILYTCTVAGPVSRALNFPQVRDRAQVFVNGVLKGVVERTGKRDAEIPIELHNGETAQISILVENMGRVNYGPDLWETRGLPKGALLGVTRLSNFTTYSLPLETPPENGYGGLNAAVECPAFLRGRLTIEGEPADTFVLPEGFTRGVVYVNGFALGRYDNSAGPQKTLYLPAPLLHTGENEITVLELEGFASPCVTLTDTPQLGECQ